MGKWLDCMVNKMKLPCPDEEHFGKPIEKHDLLLCHEEVEQFLFVSI